MNVPLGFAVIEEYELEAVHCYDEEEDVPVECAAPQLCTAHGGVQCRTWLIRGPVRGWSDDGWRLSTLTFVRALASLPPHEVYVRSMGLLVPGTYVDNEDAFDSVRFVAMARTQENLSWGTTSPTSSYRGLTDGQDLEDDHIKIILRQAAAIMRSAGRRVSDGHVALVHRQSAVNDVVNKAAMKALLRQRSVQAVSHYRRRGAAAMRSRWHKLVQHVGAKAVAQMRHILELEKVDRTGQARRRSTRIRLSWGASQMHLLPTPAQLREERRRAFDDSDRIGHFFFTRDGASELQRWDYIRGSGSAGIRRYRSADGTKKRLRSYNNRYWETPTSGDAEEEEDLSEDEDGGIFFDNQNAETEGCYAPVEQDAAKLKELVRMSHSYLEDDDGQGELKILAVGFDIVAALQRAIDRCAAPDPTCAEDAKTIPVVGTLAADGGCVRGKNITAFTFVLSWPHLKEGRTELTPMLYSFSQEKNVDELVSKAVRRMVGEVMATKFTMAAPVDESAGAPPADDDPMPEDVVRIALMLHAVVQVCGTFHCVAVTRWRSWDMPLRCWKCDHWPLFLCACAFQLQSRER